MSIKLTTPEQVALLRQGDIIIRFPSNNEPEDLFNAARTTDIDTYEIRSVNPENKMLSLVMTGSSANAYAAPVDVGRIFIRSSDLITEKVWWV